MDGASLCEAGHNTDPQTEFCSINNRLLCYKREEEMEFNAKKK